MGAWHVLIISVEIVGVSSSHGKGWSWSEVHVQLLKLIGDYVDTPESDLLCWHVGRNDLKKVCTDFDQHLGLELNFVMDLEESARLRAQVNQLELLTLLDYFSVIVLHCHLQALYLVW